MLWARAFSQRTDVNSELARAMDEMALLPGVTVTLALREHDEAIIIDARNKEALGTNGVHIGMRLPVAFSAFGKAYLNHMSDSRIERLFDNGLPEPLTKTSVEFLDRLTAQTRRCRVEGNATDDQETTEGVTSFVTTILDVNDQPAAAIATSLLSTDPRLENRQDIIDHVKKIADRVSIRLGADLGE